MFINYRSFKFKPGLLLILLVVVLLAQAYYSYYQNAKIKDQLSQHQSGNLQKSEMLKAIESQVQLSDLNLKKFLLTGKDHDVASWKLNWAKAILPAVNQLQVNQENQAIYNALKSNLENLQKTQHEVVDGYKAYQKEGINKVKSASLVLQNHQQIMQEQLQKVNENLSYWQIKLSTQIEDNNMALLDEVKHSKYANVALVAIGIAIALIFFLRGFTSFRSGIRDLEKSLAHLSQGNLPKKKQSATTELKPLFDHVNLLSENFSKIRQFALAVGDGKFENEIDVFDRQGAIGSSLIEMTGRLKNVAEAEKQRIWMNEGFAQFGDLLRKNSDNLKEMADQAISQLVKYCDLNQGALFIKEQDKEGDYLYLVSCYAYSRKKHLQAKIRPGEDLPGQCYLEKETIYLTDVPENYINITSGLGEATPRNIFIVPLIFNQEVFGVIELASFKLFSKHEQEFVEKIAENLASAVSLVKNNQNTLKLLEESQDSAEQLRAQEEELRQNMEELAATQEEMRRNQTELAYNEAKIRMIYENAFDAIITFNSGGQIDLFNPAAAKIFSFQPEDIKGEDVHNLLYLPDMKRSESLVSQYMEGYLSLGSKQINMKARRRNGEVFPIRAKLEQSTIGNERIFIMFLEDITQEEETRLQIENNKKAMQEKEANLRALINNTKDTIFAIDKEYRITVVNDVLTAKYAKSGIELKEGLNILQLLPADLADYWKKQYDRALAGEQFSYLQENKNGQSTGFIEVYLNPIRNDNDQVIGVSVLSRDITEHLKHFNGEKKVITTSGSQALANKMSQLDNLDKVTEFIKQQISQNEDLLKTISQLEIGNHYNGNGKKNGHLK